MVDKIRQSLRCIIMRDRPIEALEESWVGGEVRLYFSHICSYRLQEDEIVDRWCGAMPLS